jgi:hypothetical protein
MYAFGLLGDCIIVWTPYAMEGLNAIMITNYGAKLAACYGNVCIASMLTVRYTIVENAYGLT